MFEYLTGIYNITPTPFKPDGSLDEPSLRQLTEFTRGTRVNGMTILGVLGEADKLTEAERDRVTAMVIDSAGPAFPICVGTTHAGTPPDDSSGNEIGLVLAGAAGTVVVLVILPCLFRRRDRLRGERGTDRSTT